MAEFLGMLVGKLIKIIRLFFRYIRRHKIFGAVTSLVIMIAFSLLLFNKADAHETSDQVLYKYFHTITIEEGDTLWSIAATAEYVDDSNSYMNEIRQLNKITNNEIYAGETLVVPYYSTEFCK